MFSFFSKFGFDLKMKYAARTQSRKATAVPTVKPLPETKEPVWYTQSASAYPMLIWKPNVIQPLFLVPCSRKPVAIATRHGASKMLKSRKLMPASELPPNILKIDAATSASPSEAA